jgi:CheY-like chemotaxis protein
MNRILLIDDDLDDQFFFKEIVQSINPTLNCDTTTNAKIALDELKVSASLPDIIFIDLNMPIMNGFDFLVEIKKEDKLTKIPVGIISTSNIMSEKELAKELGARFFITKPNDFNILRKKLQQILSADISTDEYISIT